MNYDYTFHEGPAALTVLRAAVLLNYRRAAPKTCNKVTHPVGDYCTTALLTGCQDYPTAPKA